MNKLLSAGPRSALDMPHNPMVRSPAKQSRTGKSESQPPPSDLPKAPTPVEDPQQRLEALEQELRSKGRTLALLDAKLPKDGKDLAEQLVSRDKRIEELNERVIQLEAAANPDLLLAKSHQISKLTEERDNLTKENQRLEASTLRLESQVQSLTRDLREAKSSVKSRLLDVQSEAEAASSQLLAKSDQAAKMKTDIVQLSKIVKDMSQLNGELNEKVQRMNKDMEGKNTELYSATAKAEHMEELEQALAQGKAEAAALRAKLQKMLEDRSHLEAMEDLSRVTQEALKDIEGQVNALSPAIGEAIQRIRHDMKKVTTAPRTARDDPLLLKQQIKELKGNVADLTLELKRQVGLNESQIGRIRALEREKVDMRKEMEASCDRLEKRAKTLLDGMEKARERMNHAEEETMRLEGEAAKGKNLLIGLQSQVQMLKEQLKEAKAAEEQASSAFQEMKTKLAKMKLAANAQEMSLFSREAKLKQIASKLKLLTDEIWRKDTELLRKDGRILNLEQEVARVTSEFHNFQAELKGNSECAALEQSLREKCKEVEMLKEMLRSSSKQVHHKDIDLSRTRRKLEALVVAPVDPAVTLFVEEMDALLDAREKVRTCRGKVPAALVKKRLGLDDLPSDKGDLLRFIEGKMEEAANTLEKSLKSSTKVNISEYCERVTSPELKSALSEDQMSITVGRLLAKCRSL